MNAKLCLLVLAAAAVAAHAEESPFSVDFGADLRVRQEIMDNVPGLPGGGLLSRVPHGSYKNHMRFRPRVWGEISHADGWRIYTRVADEFRWNVKPRGRAYAFPDEMVLDNLFFESKGIFDGFLDLKIGRQDLYRNMYGLDHLFIDGTPGDGSRTVFADVVKATLNFGEEDKLDLFMLHDWDENPVRWGTHRSRHRSLSGLGGGTPDMDDWGWGGVYSGKAATWLPYQVFAMQKLTEPYRRGGVKQPRTRRELLGFKLVPQLTDEISLQLEAMGQVGRDGEGAWLTGWSTFSGINWKSSEKSGPRPFASAAVHVMSGDKDAAKENGGHHAWDPMWSRGVNDSELMLYGTHYGVAWWSNMVFLRFESGVEFGRHHALSAMAGPMFAAVDDGLGGGDGNFKGFLSHLRYDFPLLLADKDAGRRFEIVGHLFAELFNPGDYYETDKPAWFLRWQLEFKF